MPGHANRRAESSRSLQDTASCDKVRHAPERALRGCRFSFSWTFVSFKVCCAGSVSAPAAQAVEGVG